MQQHDWDNDTHQLNSENDTDWQNCPENRYLEDRTKDFQLNKQAINSKELMSWKN